MSPDVAKRLLDAVEAARHLERFVAGRTFAEFSGDDMVRAAVERKFEIIGETVKR